jgi:hypothetical protein
MSTHFDCARGYNTVRKRVRYLCARLLTLFRVAELRWERLGSPEPEYGFIRVK